jgi:hypothetical protein
MRGAKPSHRGQVLFWRCRKGAPEVPALYRSEQGVNEKRWA